MAMTPNRTTIFISHATPEDNDVARWLGARLELAGYKVWYDLSRLKGGDYFWTKIERVIRDETCRMVAVVSNASVQKQNVKNEWQLGLVLEKENPGFVIPITVSDFDFSNLPVFFIGKNAIPFQHGWHKGLSALLDTLTDANVPIVLEPDPRSTRHWLTGLGEDAIRRTEHVEFLDSTWLRIKTLPPALETARILGQHRGITETEQNREVPWFEFEDRIVGFAKSSDLVKLMSGSVILAAASAVDLETFIGRDADFAGSRVDQGESRKRVVHLIRQAWDLELERRGFAVHSPASGRKIHFVTPDLTGGRGQYVSFEDFDGRKRRKVLNGRSERRKVNWAYGVGIAPSLAEPRRIELRATVIFTDDDGEPVDPAWAHRLRRSFCRNWWNDQWRSLLRAFIALISDEDKVIRLAAGSGRLIEVEAAPLTFTASAGLSDRVADSDSEPDDGAGDGRDDDHDHDDESDEDALS